MTENISYIPTRIKNVAKGGHVTGTEDIIDDDLGMTQDEINKIVFSGNVTVSLSTSVNTVFARTPINIILTATSSVIANKITINTTPVTSINNSKTLSHTFELTPIVGNNSYTATFEYNGVPSKTASKTITGVDKIYYGLGTESMQDYDSISTYCPIRTNPIGVTMEFIPTIGNYCYILLPTSMGNTDYSEKIKIESSGLGYSMDRLSETITKDGTTYYVYKGNEPNRTTDNFKLIITN